jgi:hypothetical protein
VSTDLQDLAAVRANVFAQAHPAVADWLGFNWHRDRANRIQAHKVHSSQALALDVFGTIAVSEDRDRVIAGLADLVGLPTEGPWTLSFEWRDPDQLLNEPRPTQVDVLAESPTAFLLIECKFTEPGGRCSQIARLRRGRAKGNPQCNGRYEPQINPENGTHARCALTGKGIRYWEIIGEIFDLDPMASYNPCPFRGDAYQWMRNLALAAALNQHWRKKAALIVAYAANGKFPTSSKAQDLFWLPRLKPSAPPLRTISYQEIASLAARVSNRAVWRELEAWVDRKTNAAASAYGRAGAVGLR